MQNSIKCFALGFLGYMLVWSAISLADISDTLRDDRAILSDMRDSLNCQTWPTDPACAPQ